MTNRKNTPLVGLAGVTLIIASCAQIAGMEEGVLRPDGAECKVFEDCLAQATECRVPDACNDGKCQFNNTIRDKPIKTQKLGDCKKTVCDGEGSTEDIVDDTDVNDDNNECTADSCDGGDMVHTPIPGKMLACYTGPDGTNGVGICVGGMQTCDAQGQPGNCEGEVVPQAVEVCDTASLDENCNGMSNETGAEGGTCMCGDKAVSSGLGETCDDGNLVGGDGCSPLCSSVQAVQVAVGGFSTCVRFNNDTVKCWGNNDNGQLGIGSMMAVGYMAGQMGGNLAEAPMVPGKKILRLVPGWTSFFVVLDDNTLRGWGGNDAGQLGEGNTFPRGDLPGEMGNLIPPIDLGTTAKIVDVGSGQSHSCVLFDDGSIKCWGGNIFGQLGLGDTMPRGTIPDQMGTNLPPVNLGMLVKAKKLAVGDNHNCAILMDDSVKCWGSNSVGELGLGDTTPRGTDPVQMGDALLSVDLGPGRTAKAISAGTNHTCAILDDDTVKCWGYNNFGQLGIGDYSNRGDEPLEMGILLPGVDLGPGGKPVQLVAGYGNTCVLRDDQTLKCWGGNVGGQLGTGDNIPSGGSNTTTVSAQLPIDLGTGRHAISFDVGTYSVCTLLDDTSVKCWGYNTTSGQLGLGDTSNHGDEPNEMGDNLPIVKLFADTW